MLVDSVTYEPYVKYAYVVGDRTYEHDKFASAVRSAIREPASAEAIVRGYFLLFGCALFVASVVGLLRQW